MKKKAVVLLSGGLDSATCLAYATSKGYKCYALSFNYAQRNNAELNAAKNIANFLNVEHHEIVDLPFDKFKNSALINRNLDIPDYAEYNGIPITYVPARNTIFLSFALGWSEIFNADYIAIGVNAVDYSGYPDCRPEYIDAFQKMANLATKAGIEGNTIQILTPLIRLNKAQIITLGTSLGVNYALTISCYQVTPDGLACGRCDSCHFRKQGFTAANIPDPTHYVATIL